MSSSLMSSNSKQRDSKSQDFFSARIRRASTPAPTPSANLPKSSIDSDSAPFAALHIPAPHSRPSTAETSGHSLQVSSPSLSHSQPSLLKRTRGSLLVAASDALGNLRFGRKRNKSNASNTNPLIPHPPIPVVLPEVIEISAPRRDEEVEEREKLKEAAARAILGPAFLSSSLDSSREKSDTAKEAYAEDEEHREEDHEREEDGDLVIVDLERHRSEDIRSLSPDHSSLSMSMSMSLHSPLPVVTRRHSASRTHSRNNSLTPISIPVFPSTPSALAQFTQESSTLPKYYPPSSLRIFALSRQWKTRFMVLSSPSALQAAASSSNRSSPAPSYLHLFKSSGMEEKELERLEINEESVVFVAEEEVGGRRQVVKVGGVDVGALKRELNYEEGGRTMWFLQITDAAEAQRWIAVIKHAILGQRTVRAGLPPLSAQTLLTNEPKGDMDVMLTMRAQGIGTSPSSKLVSSTAENHANRPLQSPTFVSSPTTYAPSLAKTSTTPPSMSMSFPDDQVHPYAARSSGPKGAQNSKHGTGPTTNYASSTSSQSIRSQATGGAKGSVHLSSIVPSNAVSALKGLFTRPRSPSLAGAASIGEDGERERGYAASITSSMEEKEMGGHTMGADESFTSAGSSLLGMLKSGDAMSRVSFQKQKQQQHVHTMLPIAGGPILTGSGVHHSSALNQLPTMRSAYGAGLGLERKIVSVAEAEASASTNPPSSSLTSSINDKDNGIHVDDIGVSKNRANKSLSLGVGALSLQPPPRKRWTSIGHPRPSNNEATQARTSTDSDGPRSSLDILRDESSSPRRSEDGVTESSENLRVGGSMMYKQVNGNNSMAGSFGVSLHERAATQLSTAPSYPNPPASPSTTISGQSALGTPEERPRASSIQSVSTFASGEIGTGAGSVNLDRSSTSTKRSGSFSGGSNHGQGIKRWSRQGSSASGAVGSKLLNVPTASGPSSSSSSTTTAATTPRLHPHPYAASADRPPSRTSTRSGTSQQSIVSGLPNVYPKRASTSSGVSVNTSSSVPVQLYHGSHGHTQAQGNNSGILSASISRVGASHRTSMPPPRPAPTSALPPAPVEIAPTPPAPVSISASSSTSSSPSPSNPSKPSFRESMAQRAFRLSLMAPKPPPSTNLPPRPDEPTFSAKGKDRLVPFGHHRRTSSAGSATVRRSSELYTIPSSPLSVPMAMAGSPPFPPPSGPLPPTPPPPSSNFASAPPSRHSSIKHRLRILSNPSQSHSQTAMSNGSTPNLTHVPVGTANLVHSPLATLSQPSTPIAEKITHLQNDPSFLQMHTPILPSLPTPKFRTITPPLEQYPEVTSLSPPPRRSSKQMSLFEESSEAPGMGGSEEDGTVIDVEPKPISLSQQGSVISLGIVSM